MTAYIAWTIAIVGFGILEAVTVQLVSIWFVAGSVAGLIAALCHANTLTQILVAIIVSVICLLVTRPLVKKKLDKDKQPTNADMNIGKEGIVIADIDELDANGQVKIGGQIWSAKTNDLSTIKKDTYVIVEKIEGVKLVVRKKED